MEEIAWHKVMLDRLGIWYQEAGQQDAPGVVLIHGLSCDSGIWKKQISFFAQKYHVLAPDLPGSGRSDKPHDVIYSMALFARAVRAMLNNAHMQKPILIGHSMGFSVLRRYLALYPNSVRAICNVDGFYFRDPLQAILYKRWRDTADLLRWPILDEQHRMFLTGVEIVEYSFYGRTPVPLRQEMRRRLQDADRYVIMSCWESMLNPEEWTPLCFENVPAFVLYAKAGHTLPDSADWFRTLFPKLTYREWDDTGHYMMLEQPERFNTQVIEFIENCPVV